MKKIKILILVIILLIISTVAAYSIEFPDVKDTKYEEAIKFLSAYEVIDGFPDGTYKLNDYVTRAQISRVLTVVLGYKEYSQNMTSVFTDMKGHWAEKYVEIMDALDIVQGYLDGTFGPDDYVTYSEAVTMIVRSLGYTDRSLPGDWPYDYYIKAGELGIVKGTTITSGNITRGDIALMIYNAVNCNTVTVDNENQINKNDKILLNKIGTKETQTITLDYLEKPSKINLEKYLFNTGDIYYNYNNKIVHVGNIISKKYSGRITTQLSYYKVFVTDKNGNIKPFDIHKVPIYYNGAEGNVSSLLNADVTVIYNEDNKTNMVKGIIAEEITDVLDVEAEDLYIKDSNKFIDKYLPLNKDKKPNYQNIIVTGAVDNLFDIKQKDILYFYETNERNNSKSKLKIEVIRNKAYGRIEKTNNKKDYTRYTINGIDFYQSTYFIDTEDVELGYEVEALLDKEGKIVRFYITKYYNEPETYGLVLGKEDGIIDKNTTVLPQIQILDQNGKTKIYEIEENSDILIKEDNGFKTELKINLEEEDIIKFDIEDNGQVKLIEKSELNNISGIHNDETGLLDTEIKIDNNTIIFYKDKETYKMLPKQELGEFITANVLYNYKDEIIAMYLIEGVKNTYSGELYTIIKEVSQVSDAQGNTVEKVSFYTINSLYTSSEMNKSITDYKNKFVKLTMEKGKILEVELVTAENEITKVETIYSTLIKIDGTYYEILPNVIVYICTTNDENIINNVKKGTIKDINVGDKVQFFDASGNYEGIIDAIIVYE